MRAETTKQELLNLASSLRPAGKPSVSILEIAHQLGAVVSLQLHTARKSETAQINLRSRPPKILLYRFNSAQGEREIDGREEGILTPRERFSIAHELGHWLLLDRLGIDPQQGGRSYWVQEEAVNAFAGKLLVPDWLAEDWLGDTRQEEPVPTFALRKWAEQSRVSEEVVAKALVRHRDQIGFLRLLPSVRKRDGLPVLQAILSARGARLELPNERSHLADPELMDLVNTSQIGSTKWFVGLRLGRCPAQDLGVTWRHGNRFDSRTTFWLSFIRGAKPSDRRQSSFPAFSVGDA